MIFILRCTLREFIYYLTYHAKLNLVVHAGKAKSISYYITILTEVIRKKYIYKFFSFFLIHYIISLKSTVTVTQYIIIQNNLHAYIAAIKKF